MTNDHHVFEFNIDKRFFDEYSYSLVKAGNVKTVIDIEKQETMIVVTFLFTGSVSLTCDLCLGEFPHTISKQDRLIVKFHGDHDISDETEEILILAKGDHEIDLAPLIYEYINLAVPIHARCKTPGETAYCDQVTLSKLRDLSERSSNENDHDPRWDILKKIKNN